FPYPTLFRSEYARTVEIDPWKAEAQMLIGRVYFEQKQYEKAVDAYKKAVEIDPGDPLIHYHLSQAYRRLGMYEEAAKEDQLSRSPAGGG
ncbi:MAG: tetratricopeptide repeat protein, partial [Candidatus Brocadiales bacterium]|nr:tetratricopeptide repeat protein [Candidatus Bathyanammoxibius sp.]